MKPIKTQKWLDGAYRLPAGWIPLAMTDEGHAVCMTVEMRWYIWKPGASCLYVAPAGTQQQVVAMVCEQFGGTKALAEKLGISHRTMEGFRSGVHLSVRIAYQLALLMR